MLILDPITIACCIEVLTEEQAGRLFALAQKREGLDYCAAATRWLLEELGAEGIAAAVANARPALVAEMQRRTRRAIARAHGGAADE